MNLTTPNLNLIRLITNIIHTKDKTKVLTTIRIDQHIQIRQKSPDKTNSCTNEHTHNINTSTKKYDKQWPTMSQSNDNTIGYHGENRHNRNIAYTP